MGRNTGLFMIYMATKGAKIVDLARPLLIDVFQQRKLLLNGVSITINSGLVWTHLDSYWTI